MKITMTVSTVLALLTFVTLAGAEVKLTGHFIARKECPAYQSFRNQTNPGNVMTRENATYDLLAKNNTLGSYYLIRMNAEPSSRWVAVTCGDHGMPGEPIVSPAPPVSGLGYQGQEPRYLLAVSWQPSFCETKPDKAECRHQTETRFDATHFTLHGLWPQPRGNEYCGVLADDVARDKNGKWQQLQEPTLDSNTMNELKTVMPGTQSYLQRHEWTRHGTCYNGKSADQYFRDALEKMRELNAEDSVVRRLFAENIGKEITASQIADAFEQNFGNRAGDKIKIACVKDGNRLLISEITIGLQGNLPALTMREALLAAPKANDRGCSKGIVDPVGAQ
ncbi:MAG: ribonuclease T2 [Pseudomonadota bacterium]